LVELQIERAAMDCFVRSNRPSSAVSLFKSSQPVTGSAMGPVKLSANPVTALRTALMLASASDWAAAEGILKRLMDDRKASAEKRAQEFAENPRGGPPGSWEGDAESSLFDKLAALQYAPGVPASRLLGVSYLKALWRAKGGAAPFEDVDRAFRLAQRTELGVAAAIAKMAARGVGGPELGERVRKLEDLKEEEARLSDRKIGLVGHDDVGERLKEIAAEIAQIEAE